MEGAWWWWFAYTIDEKMMINMRRKEDTWGKLLETMVTVSGMLLSILAFDPLEQLHPYLHIFTSLLKFTS